MTTHSTAGCVSPPDREVYRRDSSETRIEDRLGEILIDLYEESEVVRVDRERRETEQKKREEEKRRRELLREQYNREVECALALENAAMDWETAC